MAADTLCSTPYGDYRLRRYPTRRDEPLQAWCAADLLLLEELHTLGVHGDQLLVVNDDHGALSVPLQPAAVWTDSALASLAIQQNLADNDSPEVAIDWSTDPPTAGVAVIALRVPKQLQLLEYQLATLGRQLPQGATVLAAGMDKHLSPRVADLLERHIGPTQRHRGQRKARLFSSQRDNRPAVQAEIATSYYCEAAGGELQSMPNVFSQDRLDGGARLLLDTLANLEPVTTLADLACGNGVLGLAALRRELCQQVVFADESAMAIASARLNVTRLVPGLQQRCVFHHGDGLLNYQGPKADLILCNPPFHLNHAVDEYAGRRLLAQCARHLEPGGRLCLVANRHLDYKTTLRRDFRRIEKLAQDKRFIVCLAQRS